MYSNTTGYRNLAIGKDALQQNVTGQNNIALGFETMKDSTGGDNCIVIGANAEPTTTTTSNEATIGDANITVLRTAGSILPFVDDSKDLGSASLRWANVYTGDIHLSNRGKQGGNKVDGTTGDWTIQEGDDSLYILNNKNGKKYKFKLEEM